MIELRDPLSSYIRFARSPVPCTQYRSVGFIPDTEENLQGRQSQCLSPRGGRWPPNDICLVLHGWFPINPRPTRLRIPVRETD